MSSNAVALRPDTAVGDDLMERVIMLGDLSKLTGQERVLYNKLVCESIGLNYLTRPLQYILLDDVLTLYATKSATDQLRKLHGVSIIRLDERREDGLYKVWATAQDREGRTDQDLGAVGLSGWNKSERKAYDLSGNALGNAMKKAVSQAKRRVTLSICGLGGLLDETEIEQVPGARRVDIDPETGEILGNVVDVRAATPTPMRPVPGGDVDVTTGEFTPLPEVDSPIGVTSSQGTPAASTSEPEPDNLDEVAPHAYRQRLYRNSRKLEHPTIHALAVHFWPGIESVTKLSYRQVDQLLHWINTTPPATFDPTLDAAIEAASDRVDEADIAAAQAEAEEAISEDEAQQVNWREQIEAACAEPTNVQAWRDLVLQAGTEEWRWVGLMALAPSKEKLGSLHTYAGKAKALSDGVKAAHNRRLEALQARIDQHTS